MAKKRKYEDLEKKKKQAVKKRCDKKESRNQYKNQKYLENLT